MINRLLITLLAVGLLLSSGSVEARRVKAVGNYTAELTEFGGNPLPPGLFVFNETLLRDGTYIFTEHRRFDPSAALEDEGVYIGRWEVVERNRNAVKVRAGLRRVFVNSDGIIAPPTVCPTGCLETTLISIIIDADGNFSGESNTIGLELDGTIIPGIEVGSKFVGKRFEIEDNIEVFEAAGATIPDMPLP